MKNNNNQINFDKTQYIKLLKKAEILKNEGTFLSNENREELNLLQIIFLMVVFEVMSFLLI